MNLAPIRLDFHEGNVPLKTRHGNDDTLLGRWLHSSRTAPRTAPPSDSSLRCRDPASFKACARNSLPQFRQPVPLKTDSPISINPPNTRVKSVCRPAAGQRLTQGEPHALRIRLRSLAGISSGSLLAFKGLVFRHWTPFGVRTSTDITRHTTPRLCVSRFSFAR